MNKRGDCASHIILQAWKVVGTSHPSVSFRDLGNEDARRREERITALNSCLPAGRFGSFGSSQKNRTHSLCQNHELGDCTET